MNTVHWVWEPSILLGLLALTLWYTMSVNLFVKHLPRGRQVRPLRQIAFHLGTVAVFLALSSPLDALGDEALFSAHMGQHMLLTFVAPPLWLIGTPSWLVESLLPFPMLRRLFEVATEPVMAFIIFMGTMWIWHLPSLYDAALRNETLHIAEHLCFMGSAIIGWWPLLGADRPVRYTPQTRIGYLVTSMFACTALAAIITLSPRVLYTFYGKQPTVWGLSPRVDQQLGGVIMWVPGDMLYMLLITFIFYRWLNENSTLMYDELKRVSNEQSTRTT